MRSVVGTDFAHHSRVVETYRLYTVGLQGAKQVSRQEWNGLGILSGVEKPGAEHLGLVCLPKTD